jgi:tetratricopeptide (TPR) repeat protein
VPAGCLPALRALCDRHGILLTEALAAGRYGEARELLSRAVDLTPGDYSAHIALGTAYERLGRYGDAAGCYSTAIALAPAVSWCHYSRGLAYLRLRDYARARADLDRAAELNPDHGDTYLSRALAAQGLADYPAALKDLDRAVEAGAPEVRAGFMRARVLDLSGDRAGARREVERALRTEPADELTWVARGVARVGPDPAGALADFEAALKLNPRSLLALQNKAHVLGKLKRTDEAIRSLDGVVELYPDFVAARAGRAVLHARSGNWAAARADVEESLKRDSGSANVYQAAGVYALLSRHDPAYRAKAIELLTTALRSGFGHDHVETDPDLDPIRTSPEFKRLADAAGVIRGGKDR